MHWSLENPASSRLFTWAPLASFIASTKATQILIHYCQYGCTYKKPALLITDHRDIAAIGRACSGGHRHEVLERKVSVSIAGVVQSRWKTVARGGLPAGAAPRLGQGAGRGRALFGLAAAWRSTGLRRLGS